MAMIAKLQNYKLKNKSIITSVGTFTFNADGVILASRLPKELLYELVTLKNFKAFDKTGNEILDPTIENTAPELPATETEKPTEEPKPDPKKADK